MGNRATSLMSPSSRAAPDGPIPCNSSSALPVASTRSESSLLATLIFRSIRTSSAMSSAASLRRVLPTTSRGRTVASSAFAWVADRNVFAPPGISSTSSRCNRFTVNVRAAPSSSRRSASSRSATVASSTCTTRRPGVRSATTATECASVASVLRPCPVENTRTRADNFAGTSTTGSPSATNRCARFWPTPAHPSTAQIRSGQRRPAANSCR